MNKQEFIKQLKQKMILNISKLELKCVNAFYRNPTTKKLLKEKRMPHDFGRAYELYIAWLFHSQKSNKSNYDDFVVKIENNNKEGKANDGVDIIYPYQKILYVIQVKTSDQSHDTFKLEKRADEFLSELQNSDTTVHDISRKWQISNKVVKKMKENKDSFIQKTLWITPNGSTKESKLKNSKTKCWGIFQIINLRNFPNPENEIVDENYEFKVTSAFSHGKNKSIIERDQGKITSLIMPLEIKQLYFLIKNKMLKNKKRKESLFAGNVRYYQGNNKITKSIKRTLEKRPQDFYKFNNGITTVAQKIRHLNQDSSGNNQTFKIQGINIINGQQTTYAIMDACEDLNNEGASIPSDAYVLFKIFAKLKSSQVNELAMATNQQKLIKASELISNWDFNRILQNELIKKGIFYKPKTGNNDFTNQYKEWPKVKLIEILKYWYIKEEGDVWVKNKVNTFVEALVFPHLFSKNIQEQYRNISKKFKKMRDKEKAVVFKEIANIFVEIKKLKAKKSERINVKQSLDMYSYFLLTNTKVAESEKFVEYFNKIVNKFTLDFVSNDKSKNIANAFKSKKNSGNLFVDLKNYFNDLIASS